DRLCRVRNQGGKDRPDRARDSTHWRTDQRTAREVNGDRGSLPGPSNAYFGNQHQNSRDLTSFPILNRYEETKRGPNKSENRKVQLRVEPGEALSTAAQIAVALAGFAGVVVVFRRESVHEWSPIDKFRLRILLTNSILPLAFCMIGLLLLTIKPNPTGAWRWCSGLTFAVLFLFGVGMMRIFRSFDPAQLRSTSATGFTFYSFAVLGTAAMLF